MSGGENPLPRSEVIGRVGPAGLTWPWCTQPDWPAHWAEALEQEHGPLGEPLTP